MRTFHASVFALGVCALTVGCTSSAPPAAPASASAAPASIGSSCIDPRNIVSQNIVSDQEIHFKLRNGQTWTNKLVSACSGLRIAGGFSWDIRGSLACSNQETITVLNSGNFCLLGEFSQLPSKS